MRSNAKTNFIAHDKPESRLRGFLRFCNASHQVITTKNFQLLLTQLQAPQGVSSLQVISREKIRARDEFFSVFTLKTANAIFYKHLRCN